MKDMTMRSNFQNMIKRTLLVHGLTIELMLVGTTSLLAQDQPVKFQRIGPEHGLSQSSVYCILQDHQGFMWFGTDGGLNKYDGYNFTVYRHDAENPYSLSNGTIMSLYEDRSGVLWIGTYGGLNKFDRENDAFIRYQRDPKNPNSLSGVFVLSLYEDHTGVLWVGTNRGLNKFNREKEAFTHYQHDPKNPNSLSENRVRSLYVDRAGVLWIGTGGGGLNKFDREKQIFTRYQHDPGNPNSLSDNFVWSIHEDHAGVFWIGTQGGLNRFDREKETFTHYQHDPKNPNSLNEDEILSFYEDRAGMLWIGTDGGGLNRFDRERQIFTRYAYDPKNPNSLSTNRVRSLYEDRAGVLWISVDGAGLNKVDRKKEKFTHYQHHPENPNSLSNNRVKSLYEDRTGVLWIGTDWGLNRFDREKERFTHYQHDPTNPNSLSENRVRPLSEDRAGMIWIGTNSGGLNKFDPEREIFTRYRHDPHNPNSLSDDIIWSLDEDHAGMLWIGTYIGGLNMLDRETEAFTRYQYDPDNPNSLNDTIVRSIYEDRAGMLWIGTDGGFNKFDRAKGTFTRYKHDPQNPNSVSSNRVRPFHEDRTGMLWIGTWGGGLNKYDREKEIFTRYNVRDGLPDDVIYGILEDNLGNLWISTNNGLSKFNPQTKRFRNYDVGDGLQSNEFSGSAYHKSNRTGEMFFGGVNGFNVFHPDSVRDNTNIPPVVFTAFKRYNSDEAKGESIIEKGISAKAELTLSYKDNILTFEFAALNYRSTFKNQYAYKLEGFHDNWLHLGTKRDVTFTNLDPGEYTLRVKGSNNDGIWNEEGASLKITITPPWWKTLWAYTLYALLIAGVLYGLRRYELNRVHLKNQLHIEHMETEKIKELDHVKSRFFANISHEFRTPLTLILGPVEQMRSNEFKGNLHEAYDMILRNGRRLLRLINQLLDLARLEAGGMSLQARPENIVSFLKGLVLSFASAAERKRISLSISTREENVIVYFDRDKLEKIVSNLLSNALKFTPEGGRVAVGIERKAKGEERKAKSEMRPSPFAPHLSSGEFIEISVSDTGPGIPTEQREKIFDRFYQVDASQTREHEGTGIGLALTKELVELHHGEIVVESEAGHGTTFIVRLPLGKEHLRQEEVLESDQLPVTSDQFARRIEDQGSSIKKPSLQQSTDPSIQSTVSSDETLILVIEDNRDVRAYIRQYLEPAFRVIEAIDGVEGVAQALEVIPDLIICDVMMPKRDGYEVCRILKTEEKTSHVPIIMLTAKADRESKVQGLETGADDYLIKPFDARELLARVHNLIKLRQQLRARFGREITVQPKDIAITSMDEQFLSRAMQVVEEHMSESELGVEFLAHKIGMSRVHLNRKLRGLTDQTANEFIRTLRLKRAAQLLAKKSATVLEIAYEVGFNNPSYFAECFEKQFGVLPSKFAERDKS